MLLYKEGIPLDKFPLTQNEFIFTKYKGNTLPVNLSILDKVKGRIETESSIKLLDKKRSVLLNDIEYLTGMFLFENHIYAIEEKSETEPLHIRLKQLHPVEAFLKIHNSANIFFDFF